MPVRSPFDLKAETPAHSNDALTTRGNNPAKIRGIDLCNRVNKLRRVQHVDGVATELKFLAFADSKFLDQIHIESKSSGPLQKSLRKSPQFSGGGIHGHDRSRRIGKSLQRASSIKKLKRCEIANTWIRHLGKAVEVHNA